jgi:Cyclophilin type peptidyl-prolyl cis-trans isomerase/CLD
LSELASVLLLDFARYADNHKYCVTMLQAAKGKRVTTMRATLDGVNAPLTVGNFKDLAARGFYNGVPVTFIDESTVMTGLPKGKAVRVPP